MSIPVCHCRAHVQLNVPEFPVTLEHCEFHKAAGDLYEVLEAIMGQAEQVTHHRACRCIACRAIKALFKARGTVAPMAKSAVAGAGVPAGERSEGK